MNFIYLIIGLITGFVLGWILKPKKKETKIVEEYANEDAKQKAENLKKIKKYLVGKKQVTNDEIQNEFKLSNTTIGRYLEDLEVEGMIKQVGRTGRSVYYDVLG